ncbi:uncharacterized protein LOC114556103 isoform X2 [Perca flavescens]|uniref:uncharacterized protein LOC114556103 isoform X2 n=1 Tax=Perca flavescens TaxID=8167 RepID=UPI00106EF618|nr:uncharacterized protein LOC114556103 isoform X2 [Perca flavescens]
MNEAKLTFIFLLLCAAELIQGFPVTASQGGNQSVWLFFCKDPGCATNVTCVFCNDNLIWRHNHIANCTGTPPLNTVCQHGGRAFVSIDTHGECEFEGKGSYIRTAKCTDHSNICVFISATTSPQVTRDATPNHRTKSGYILGGVWGSFLLIVGLFLIAHFRNFCKQRQNREHHNQHNTSDSVVTESLREMQSPGVTSGSDIRRGPGLNENSSSVLSPCDSGA